MWTEKNNFYKLKNYLAWRIKSVNAHGLHSPFMYRLATECFYNKTDYPEYKDLKNFHKKLKKDKRIIKVEDLGAGSRHFDSKTRKIAEISKISGSNLKEMKFLYRLSRYFQPGNMLELGTNLGKSAYALYKGYPISNFITVEGDRALYETAKEYLKDTPVELIHSGFEKFLSGLSENQKFDFVYLDGNHTKEASLKYFEMLLPHLHNNSLVLLDDIHWSKEMKEAWEILKKHPEVKQSIDGFYKGFLFFRKEQYPEDFYIRLPHY